MLIDVFVNEDAATIRQVVDFVGLDAAQLNGDEDGETLAALDGIGIKAIRPRSQGEAQIHADAFAPFVPVDERLPSLLVDAYHKALYGGTGEQASVEVARTVKARTPRLMLAGGLNGQRRGAGGTIRRGRWTRRAVSKASSRIRTWRKYTRWWQVRAVDGCRHDERGFRAAQVPARGGITAAGGGSCRKHDQLAS